MNTQHLIETGNARRQQYIERGPDVVIDYDDLITEQIERVEQLRSLTAVECAKLVRLMSKRRQAETDLIDRPAAKGR